MKKNLGDIFSFTIKKVCWRKGLGLLMLLASVTAEVSADAYTDYIDRYADAAVAQMERHGIPASITLAQGLLESAAGRSTLATEGNNHFGIKCHADWEGETMLRSDDAPDECFRVYGDVQESFEDHSRFLKRKRYASLFELELTDYCGWARGLKKCGYATNPHYADILITIIERYALNRYDAGSPAAEAEMAEFIRRTMASSHIVRKSRGLHYVISFPGDTYGSLAAEFGVPLEQLLANNDVEADGEIRDWEEVYLVAKLDEGPEDVKNATIGRDETLHSLSQRFGVTMEALRRFNPKAKDKPGQRIRLHP